MRAVAVALGALAFAGGETAQGEAAQAAPPVVAVSATPAAGAAPLRVRLIAKGDAASYSWDLGDGTLANGGQVSHVYGPGRFFATVTATGPTEEVAQARVRVTAKVSSVSLHTPAAADYDSEVSLSGRIRPGRRTAVLIYRRGTYVTTVRSGSAGRFRARMLLREPGPYEARGGGARSAAHTIRVRPRLDSALAPTAALDARLVFTTRLVPARAGKVRAVIRRNGRIVGKRVGTRLQLTLPTGRAGDLEITLTTRPRAGYAGEKRRLTSRVVAPSLALGAQGPSVLALERRLQKLRYALRSVDSVYATDTLEAVLAFQKVAQMERTGRVDAALWRRLLAATVPRPRYASGTHIEVDKTRQVLLEVVDGKVERVVHVSTGLTGNTPLGRWQVYRKVTGFDWVLWYPLYFLRGFAIHGYPSVPAYPASHGCVRVPMWIAPSIFARHGYGATILVYT